MHYRSGSVGPASAVSRSRASAWRMTRETCIWLTPMTSPISRLRHVLLEAHAQHLALARGDAPPAAYASVARSSARSKPCSSTPIESPSVAGLVVAGPARGVEGHGAVGAAGLQRVEHLLLVGADRLADLRHRGLTVQLVCELCDRAIDLQRQLLQVARHADCPRAVAEVALDLAEDRRHRIGGERDLAVEIEAVDRLDEAHRGDL